MIEEIHADEVKKNVATYELWGYVKMKASVTMYHS
jgi:hypothetical protein